MTNYTGVLRISNELIHDLVRVLKHKNIISKEEHTLSCWERPSVPWLKANIDAAFTDGQPARAMVVRDCTGRAIFIKPALVIAS